MKEITIKLVAIFSAIQAHGCNDLVQNASTTLNTNVSRKNETTSEPIREKSSDDASGLKPAETSPTPGESDQTKPDSRGGDTPSIIRTELYKVSGKVRGLSGKVILQNNLGNDLAVTSDGAFEFSESIKAGGSYSVSVKTQPPGQTCSVYNRSGSNVANHVTDISVKCAEFWAISEYLQSNNTLVDNVLNHISASGSDVYLSTNSGLSISRDAGATWFNRTIRDGLGSNEVRKTFLSGNTLYAATSEGLSISTDGGIFWINRTIADGLANNIVQDVVVLDKTVYAATLTGLSASTDSGVTWKTISREDYRRLFVSDKGLYATNMFGLGRITDEDTSITGFKELGFYLLARFRSAYERFSVWDVVFSDKKIYAATESGLMISNNTGTGWDIKNEAHGLGSSTPNSLYVSEGRVYAGTNKGISISSDNGVTWVTRGFSSGLGAEAVDDVAVAGKNIYAEIYSATTGTYGTSFQSRGLAISNDSGVNWTLKERKYGPTGKGAHGLFTSDSSIYVPHSAGLDISTDGGRTWQTSPIEIHGRFITCFFASGSDLYAGTPGGLAISTNGGKTWVKRTTSNGLGGNYVHDVFVSGDVIYALAGEEDGNAGKIFTSSDGGATWSQLPTNGRPERVLKLFASGSDIYVATYNGLFISKNAGLTFTRSLYLQERNVDWAIQDVIVSGNTIYAQTMNPRHLFVSSNGGVSWDGVTPRVGNDYLYVNKIHVSGGSVYAATGSGLWISTDRGVNWTKKTTANGLMSDQIGSFSISGDTIYLLQDGNIIVNNPKENLR